MDLPVPVLIALVSTGIGMLLLTAQGSTAKLGSVPHRQWPAEGGAASVAADRTPVVLKGSPVTQWAALSRWSPEHISAHGPDVLRLVWHSAGPCLVYASESGDLGGGRRMAHLAPRVVGRSLTLLWFCVYIQADFAIPLYCMLTEYFGCRWLLW